MGKPLEDVEAIRQIVLGRPAAVLSKDVQQILMNHDSAIRLFDVVDPLVYSGLARVRQRTDEWLSLYEGPVNVDVRDLQIEASGDVAFGHYLYRVTGTLKEGKNVDMWVRATGCYRKKDGRWQLVHEHQSVPFDPKTGKASLDLKP